MSQHCNNCAHGTKTKERFGTIRWMYRCELDDELKPEVMWCANYTSQGILKGRPEACRRCHLLKDCLESGTPCIALTYLQDFIGDILKMGDAIEKAEKMK